MQSALAKLMLRPGCCTVAPEGSSPPSYQHAPVSRESAGSPHAQQQQQSTASVERAVSPASPTEQHSYSEAPTSDPHVSAQALPPTASITPPPPHTSPQGQDSTNAMSLHMLHSQPEVDTNYDIPPAFETAQHGQQALATPVISTFATSDLSAPHQPLSYPLHDEAGPTSTHGMATAQQSFGQRRATPQPPSPPVPCPSSRYTSHSTFGQPQQQPIFIQVDPLGQIDAQQGSAPVESVGQGQSVSASTLSAGEKKLGEGFSEGSSYPNTPDRLHRAPPAASPDYTTPQGSTQSSATPSDVDGMYA